MAPNKVILLACGSFNPVTNMHLRMFEIARDHLHRMGMHRVIGGLISPVHDAYGKKELEASKHRIAMLKYALEGNEWVKLSDWECSQETWSRTRKVLQHHQNLINALVHKSNHNLNEDEVDWIPRSLNNHNTCDNENIKVKLLCGADLLESFATPGLWADEDIETIVGQHGLVVITRTKTNPLEFIYNSDILTKYMSNITIVTEWIQNEVSSTKVRRSLRRNESVRYLLPDKVLDYIYKNQLYGSEQQTKYKASKTLKNQLLTPSPSDVTMESPSPTNCILICNNNLFPSYSKKLSIDTVDFSKSDLKTNLINKIKHPGQAVKIISEQVGEKIITKEVCKTKDEIEEKTLKPSKSFAHFDVVQAKGSFKHSKSNTNLKECKSCDENLIKFIFTKHGIQVISEFETIV